MKRVLLTSNLYLPNIGGIENSLKNLAFAYEELGYEVDIVCSDMNNVDTTTLPLFEQLSEHINIHRYQSQHIFIPKSIYMYISAIRLFKKLKNNSYDLVLSRYHFTTLTAKLAGFNQVSYLLPGIVKNQRLTEKATDKRGLATVALRRVNDMYHHVMQMIAVKCANRLLVFSNNMVKQLNKVFSVSPKAIEVVKPGVNLSQFNVPNEEVKRLMRKELSLPSDKILLLGLGRFVGSKAFDVAIESLRFLSEEFHLVLVGEGPELSNYHQVIQKYKLSERVSFHGRTSTPELYYAAADLFLMSSQYETLGQTVIEAQASGIPVIAFTPSHSVKTSTDEITTINSCQFSDEFSAHSFANSIEKAKNKLKSDVFNPKEISAFAKCFFTWSALCGALIKNRIKNESK